MVKIIKRVKLLEDFHIYPRIGGLPVVKINKGTIINCIPDTMGCVQIILPKTKKLSKVLKQEIPVDAYGYTHNYTGDDIKLDERILGRKYTRFIKSIRVDYLRNADLGVTYKFIK